MPWACILPYIILATITLVWQAAEVRVLPVGLLLVKGYGGTALRIRNP